jgi:opacity protein-like surface antigen
MVLVLGILLSNSVFAVMKDEMPPANQWVIGVSPGLGWISGNQTQTINLEPDVAKTYTAGDSNTSFPSGEIFVGWQRQWFVPAIKHALISQLGLSVAAAGYATLTGDIWEDADPAFNNFSYNYKVSHAQVALKGRLICDANFIVQPYISGGLGVGFNRAYDFTITPKDTAEVAAPPFNSNTTTTFTYSVGIGLQKSVTPHLQVALGYEFADWGKTQLSRASGQTVNQGLSLNHLYSQQVLLSLFYVV